MVFAGAMVIRPLQAAAIKPLSTPPPIVLSPEATACLSAAMERLLPGSVTAGGMDYFSFWLKTEPFQVVRALFVSGAAALDEATRRKAKKSFASAAGAFQDEIIKEFIAGKSGIKPLNTRVFIEQLMELTIEGYLADPQYGGNKDRAGWRFIGIPDGLKSCWWNPNGVFTVIGPKPKFTD